MKAKIRDYLTDGDIWLITHYLQYCKNNNLIITTKGIIQAISKNTDDKALQNDIAGLLRFWGWTRKQRIWLTSGQIIRPWICDHEQ